MIHLACLNNDEEIVDLLLSKGADVNALTRLLQFNAPRYGFSQ
jgi:ankyrin repeat protein